MNKNVVVIGAGLSGLSTAYHLQKQNISYQLFEKESSPGGYCRTIKSKGFLFDMGVHVLWGPSIEWVRDLLVKELKVSLTCIERNAAVCTNNIYSAYPYQANLLGRPANEVFDCLKGLHQAIVERYEKTFKRKKGVETYLDWIQYNFGEGIAKHFMISYNEKFWQYPLAEMTSQWCSSIPVPTFEQVLSNAILGDKDSFGGNSSFYYPTSGGIATVVKALANKVKVRTHVEVQSIDVDKKVVIISDNKKVVYNHLVSSMSLPLLLSHIKDSKIPKEVVTAFESLRYNTVVATCIGTSKPSTIPCHWVYYPDKDTSFYRVNFLDDFPGLVPKGKGAVIVERSFQHLPNTLTHVAEELTKLGLIRGEIETQVEVPLSPAYVIFDKNYTPAMNIITKYLESKSIHLIGRYGKWEYTNMTSALCDGRDIVNKLNGEK